MVKLHPILSKTDDMQARNKTHTVEYVVPRVILDGDEWAHIESQSTAVLGRLRRALQWRRNRIAGTKWHLSVRHFANGSRSGEIAQRRPESRRQWTQRG